MSSKSDTVAIILCGGIGSRLKPFTDTIAKPLVEFMNVPIIEYQLSALVNDAKVKTIVLALSQHVFCQTLIDFVGSYCAKHQISLLCSIEEQKLDTGGAIAHACKTFYGTTATATHETCFLVMNGDIWCHNFYLGDMKEFWQSVTSQVSPPQGLIMTTTVSNPSSYGVVRKEESTSRITQFEEKPNIANIDALESEPPAINAGIYILNKALAERMILMHSRETAFSIEKQVFPELAKEGALFYYQPSSLRWKDLGRPKDHIEALMSWFPVPIVHPSASVDKIVEMTGPVVIGANSVIEQNCQLRNCIIFSNTVVKSGCRIENSIIGNNVNLKENTIVNNEEEDQQPKCVV